ncbi:MAG TPA: methionine--tRNA ligase, partial [Pirellulales bacterium]
MRLTTHGDGMTSRRILVTSALPYANGHIHIGHLVEYVQTDVWVRFQRLQGHEVLFVCADDTHGTAIMKRARDEKRSPEAVIAEMRESHVADFAAFDVSFDNYGSTNSDENRRLCEQIWGKLQAAGLVVTKTVSQLYDAQVGEFLADRYVKGKCPNCHSPDQYGDNCEKCNATYNAPDLIEPYSTLSNTTPELRDAEHFLITIEKLREFIEREWIPAGNNMPSENAQYLRQQFLLTREGEAKPLRDWDVSRPAPYFGFPIPGTDGQHYWYVWFDAPIGYMASTLEWCQKHGKSFDKWWSDPQTEIHHFIGKDITYFHTLFWPAVLKATGYTLPTRVHIHGFLTVDGEKMSKARGTFINARSYLKHLDPEALRYFYASKLTPTISDLDLNRDEFVAKVNSDLVGKVVNLASRTARFAQPTGLSKAYPDDGGLFAAGVAASAEIAAAYEIGDYNKAMRQIMFLADAANAYVENNAPWKLAKDPTQAEALQNVCSVALNLFRQIVIYLAPVLPRLARQTGELLNNPIAQWDQAHAPLVGTPVAPFTHLMKRIDSKQVEAMVEDTKEAKPGSPKSPGPHEAPPAAPASAGEAKTKDGKGKEQKTDKN